MENEFTRFATRPSIKAAVGTLVKHLNTKGTLDVHLNVNGGVTPEQIKGIQEGIKNNTTLGFDLKLKCTEYVDPNKTYWILSIVDDEQ